MIANRSLYFPPERALSLNREANIATLARRINSADSSLLARYAGGEIIAASVALAVLEGEPGFTWNGSNPFDAWEKACHNIALLISLSPNRRNWQSLLRGEDSPIKDLYTIMPIDDKNPLSHTARLERHLSNAVASQQIEGLKPEEHELARVRESLALPSPQELAPHAGALYQALTKLHAAVTSDADAVTKEFAVIEASSVLQKIHKKA